jgi:hypothetical protein
MPEGMEGGKRFLIFSMDPLGTANLADLMIHRRPGRLGHQYFFLR